MRSEVLGLLLSGSDPLFRSAYIPLDDGLNVFYGLNGAGKTRLLRALRSALTGVEAGVTCALVVRMSGTDSEDLQSEENIPTAGRPAHMAFASSIDFFKANHGDDFAFSNVPLDEQAPNVGRAEVLFAHFLDEVLGDDSPLAREIRQSGLFLFRPVGAEGESAWTTWLVADKRSESVQRELARLDATFNHWQDLEEEGASSEAVEEACEAYETTVYESPLFMSDSPWIFSLVPGAPSLDTSPFFPVRANAFVPELIRPVLVRGRIDFGVDLVDIRGDVDEQTTEYVASLYVAAADRFARGEDAWPEGETRKLLSPAFRRSLRTVQKVASIGRSPYSDGLTSDEAFARADELVGTWAKDISAGVERLLHDFLPNPPRAALTVTSSKARFLDGPLRWVFGPYQLALPDLSRAEGYWARVAVALSMLEHLRSESGLREGARRTFVIVDEPESGLHRAAESQMARALRAQAARPGWALFVGTHSPDLLDAASARIFEVRRESGGALVKELDFSDRAALADLGLHASDLLRWPRVVLLVEGRHDALLLEAFLGSRLRSARVEVLNLRGASKLPATIDSQVLFAHTDAHVVGLLDNLRAEHLSAVWRSALETLRTEGKEKAKAVVLGGLAQDRKRGKEYEFLSEWLTRCIDADLADRVTPFALSETDIIRYLPVDRFVPSARSWDELEGMHAEFRLTIKPNNPERDFKQWLQRKHRARFDDDALLEAARGLAIPKDFELLMKTLEAIGADVATKR